MPNCHRHCLPKCVPALLLLILQMPAAGATECNASSGGKRIALLELYTSEGCSSCPPADQWLSRLAAKKSVPDNLLPLAFHVDYWNDLGWTDPFSRAQFSERQRQSSRRRGARFVVTPQFLLDGHSYQRPLLIDNIDARANAINQSPPRATLTIHQRRTAAGIGARVDVTVPAAEARHAETYIAFYENDLTTAVKAGENRGALLKHDFVVRELSAPLRPDRQGRLVHDIRITFDPGWKPRDLQLAAFVQHAESGEILQALNAPCR